MIRRLITKKIITLLVVLVVVSLTCAVAYAGTETMYYDNMNDFWYGSADYGSMDYDLEHWPGYNQSYGGTTTTAFQASNGSSQTRQPAFETRYNNHVLEWERLQEIYSTPDVVEEEIHNGSTYSIRLVMMVMPAYDSGAIYIPYEWQESSYTYYWDDYTGGNWGAVGEADGNMFAIYDYLTDITLSN